MYQKMLVPLDGSKLAECILPHVKEIARGCNVKEVILLDVVEPFPTMGWINKKNDQLVNWHNVQMKAAKEYLEKIQSQLTSEGTMNITIEVVGILEDKAAETIIDFARQKGVDIIAIATHGRTGSIGRWVFGSVADRIVHYSHLPVLMVRPIKSKREQPA